ncbi:MAG: ArnT family glycosyltransferase [Sediminibacterium sp.]
MKIVSVRDLVQDIRFWIVFFFLIRLIGITNAPLEVDHNWRQSLTNMTARNFVEDRPDLLHPRIDMAGNRTGIIGSEFPVFNYLIFLVSKVFGYAHWYGRLINLIFSSLGMWFFYKLIEKISTRQIAFTSTLIFLSSLWFIFSRKSMPDTFSVSLIIMGVYHIHNYLFENKNASIVWAFVFCTFGGLSKIPAVSLLAFLPLILFSKQIPQPKKIIAFVFLGFTAFCISFLYFFWVPYLVETYHFQLYFPKGFVEGWNEIYPLMGAFFKKFYFSALSSYLGFGAFVFGCYFFIQKASKEIVWSVALITLTFFMFILKTGAVFPLHNYYVLPFVPFMAFVAEFSIVVLK